MAQSASTHAHRALRRHLRAWRDRLLALLGQFVRYACHPFEGVVLPNWYVYTTFLLAMICATSLAINIALFTLILYALL
jgi:hypothetical protein